MKNDKTNQGKMPHQEDLCSMCKQLGYPCTQLLSNEQEAEIDNEHEQFNKLISSMKNLKVKNDYRKIGAGDYDAVLASASKSRAVY